MTVIRGEDEDDEAAENPSGRKRGKRGSAGTSGPNGPYGWEWIDLDSRTSSRLWPFFFSLGCEIKPILSDTFLVLSSSCTCSGGGNGGSLKESESNTCLLDAEAQATEWPAAGQFDSCFASSEAVIPWFRCVSYTHLVLGHVLVLLSFGSFCRWRVAAQRLCIRIRVLSDSSCMTLDFRWVS